MPSTAALKIPRRATPSRSFATDVAVPPRVRDAVEVLCQGDATLGDTLGIHAGALAAVRHGTRLLTAREAVALARLLRDASANLQLAADTIAENLQADFGRLAHDTFAHAMQEPDKERAVERALQTMFEVYA